MADDDILVRIAPVGRVEGLRGVRAFVSSTFGDMQAERDALVKRAFPEIFKRCADRDVEFSHVELRWGITDEQVADGRVLAICLGEIERSRPYFIGLLGDYYGSTPRTIPPNLVQEYPWLADGANRSVTEIEMLSILRSPERSRQALFFMRNSSASPAPDNPALRTWTSTGEAARKLERLKKEVWGSGLPVAEYHSPEDLATQVRDCLWRFIEEEFPPIDASSSREREASRHRTYVAQHARVYVGRKSTLSRLSAHLRGEGPPLVVAGPAGIGKTALIGAWLAECNPDFSGTPAVLHCAGATPGANQWVSMLRRVVRDLSDMVQVSQHFRDEAPNTLLLRFPGFLREVARSSRVLLIIDGADRIRGPSGHADWAWIPLELPPQVRVIATARPGPLLSEMEARGWSVMAIEPLAEDLQKALIRSYLSRVGRGLDKVNLERIVASPLAKHALFLRVLLSELQAVGTYAELSDQIASYLRVTSVSDLYTEVFRRWEADFGSTLVRKSLALIAVCANGISEEDLRMIIAPPHELLESAEWSPFLLSAELELSPRPGFLALTNDHISDAVIHGYLRSEDEQIAREQVSKLYQAVASTAVGFTFVGGVEKRIPKLLDHVDEAKKRFSEMQERAYCELPAQLIWLNDWDSLLEVLKSSDFLDWAFEHARLELGQYWRELSLHRPGASLVLCEDIDLSSPSGLRHCSSIAGLLDEIGELSGALKALSMLDEHYRRERSWSPLGHSLLKKADLLRKAGNSKSALDVAREAEAVFAGCKEDAGVAFALAEQGRFLADLGDGDGAIRKLQIAMRTLQPMGLQAPLAVVYNTLGSLLFKRGDMNRGTEYLKRAETIFREIGDLGGLARALQNQALALTLDWRLRDARKCREEAARILNEMMRNQEISTGQKENKVDGPIRRWSRSRLPWIFRG